MYSYVYIQTISQSGYVIVYRHELTIPQHQTFYVFRVTLFVDLKTHPRFLEVVYVQTLVLMQTNKIIGHNCSYIALEFWGQKTFYSYFDLLIFRVSYYNPVFYKSKLANCVLIMKSIFILFVEP